MYIATAMLFSVDFSGSFISLYGIKLMRSWSVVVSARAFFFMFIFANSHGSPVGASLTPNERTRIY